MIENTDGEKKGNETGDEAVLVEEGMVRLDSTEPGTATVAGSGTSDEDGVLVEEGMVEPATAGERVSLLAWLMLFGRSFIARIALLIAAIAISWPIAELDSQVLRMVSRKAGARGHLLMSTSL